MVSSLSLKQQRLLELLSAALHDRAVRTELFTSLSALEWQDVIKIAQEQSVVGLVANRILSLPKELLPERGKRMELALCEEAIRRHSKKHQDALQSIYQEYETEGFYPVLLKGLTMAQLYPEPELRSLGDIDLLLPKAGDYERANKWAESLGCRLQGDSLYEQAYFRGKTLIENHRLLTYFGIARYDRVLAELIAEITQADSWAYTSIAAQRYRTLPLELNAVYVFHHILHHFSYLGIGLRQICDWVLLMQTHSDKLQLELFESYAKRFDLLRPMQLFALMAVRHLGFSADIFPFALPRDKRSMELADLIIADTFVGGNFGFEHFNGKKFKNIWGRRWFMFKRTTLRSLRVGAISPEHIRMIPLIAIWTRIKLLFHKP